jgi:adenosylhomocysteine nucleosidase
MQPIGLIAAMTVESNALLRRVEGARWMSFGPFRGYTFEISGQSCVLVTSGMGLRRARDATHCLLELKKPGLVISFGIAGAVEPELKIGDVITPGAVCLLESEMLGPLQPLALWPEESIKAMALTLERFGVHVYPGTALTTSGTQYVRAGDMMHPILEMETAGIAMAVEGSCTRLMSIRGISDGPCAPLPVNLGEMMDENANLRVGKLLQVVIRHPAILFQSRQFLRNSRIAADNVADALVSGLKWLTSNPGSRGGCLDS